MRSKDSRSYKVYVEGQAPLSTSISKGFVQIKTYKERKIKREGERDHSYVLS